MNDRSSDIKLTNKDIKHAQQAYSSRKIYKPRNILVGLMNSNIKDKIIRKTVYSELEIKWDSERIFFF